MLFSFIKCLKSVMWLVNLITELTELMLICADHYLYLWIKDQRFDRNLLHCPRTSVSHPCSSEVTILLHSRAMSINGNLCQSLPIFNQSSSICFTISALHSSEW